MANFDSFNKGKFGSIVFLPFFVVFGVLGFASPVFFGTVSEDTLKDIGEGSKTIDQETLRQLRQNNLGPAEMLLPLTSPVTLNFFPSSSAPLMKALLPLTAILRVQPGWAASWALYSKS